MADVTLIKVTDDQLWEEKDYLEFVLANRVDYGEIEDRLSTVKFLLGLDDEVTETSPTP